MTRTLAACLFLALAPTPALAQPFDPGPMGIVPGSSMSGARIVGAPESRAGRTIPNAPIFGDTAAERAYGRDFDDSYLRPKIPRGIRGNSSAERRAIEGRSQLDPVGAGVFAREGPTAIGESAVTRGSTFSRNGRARIVKPAN